MRHTGKLESCSPETRFDMTLRVDNTSSVISYFRNTRNVDPKDFRAHLEISDDWDDI